MSNSIPQIGEKIKQFRMQAGMSQQELAEKLGYKSGTAISLIESGERGVDAADIKKFADALGVTGSLLIGEDTNLDFATALSSEANLKKKDKDDILNFYNYVKHKRK